MPTTTSVYLLMGRMTNQDGPDETWFHSAHENEDSAYRTRKMLYQAKLQDIADNLNKNPRFIVPRLPVLFVAFFELQI